MHCLLTFFIMKRIMIKILTVDAVESIYTK